MHGYLLVPRHEHPRLSGIDAIVVTDNLYQVLFRYIRGSARHSRDLAPSKALPVALADAISYCESHSAAIYWVDVESTVQSMAIRALLHLGSWSSWTVVDRLAGRLVSRVFRAAKAASDLGEKVQRLGLEQAAIILPPWHVCIAYLADPGIFIGHRVYEAAYDGTWRIKPKEIKNTQ